MTKSEMLDAAMRSLDIGDPCDSIATKDWAGKVSQTEINQTILDLVYALRLLDTLISRLQQIQFSADEKPGFEKLVALITQKTSQAIEVISHLQLPS